MNFSKLLHAFPPMVFAFLLTLPTASAEVIYADELSVNGKEFAIGNLLEWTTATETDSEFFFVEKSVDGIAYNNIGKVEAAGYSEEEVIYRYMDIQVADKEAFYRLRQVDTDGTESFSEPVEVKKELENQFMIVHFSNIMVERTFDLSIDVLQAGEMEYALTSYKGEEIFKTTRQLSHGLNDFQINMQDEPAGKYKVTFRMGDEVEVLNIMKEEDEMKKKFNVAIKKETTKGG